MRDTLVLQPHQEVDILAVVDSTNSSIEPGWYRQGYHQLFEVLHDDPGCAGGTPDRCRVADTRAGVIIADVGAGPYSSEDCSPGGHGGRLETQPDELLQGCTPPDDPWASYANGETNVAGEGDARSRFLQGFDCITGWSAFGCGFVQHLEASRRALDPALGVNPGFLRDPALLVVAMVTDDDDCSAARTELYSGDASLVGELGPFGLFRCHGLGLQCDEPLRAEGEKHNCHPAQDWLVKVDDDVSFLRALRPGRAPFFAVAGPATPFVVARDWMTSNFVMGARSCDGDLGTAVPAVRLKAVADALGPQALFNPGGVNACTFPEDPAFKALGESILAHLESQCLPAPLVTAGGGLVCSAGDEVAPGVSCAASCLDLADCAVEDVTEEDSSSPRPIPRCPADLTGTDCGGACPCWRLVAKPDLCSPQQTGSPYALQVLRATGLLAPSGTHARATCRTTTAAWGSEAMATAKQCR